MLEFSYAAFQTKFKFMLDESSYLPSIPAKLPQGPWLIISPHPDDETFGLGGALLLAAEQGIATDVLFLTSGDKGGDEGIAAIREQEALAVAQTLRIRDVSFWHLPDGSLLPSQSVIDRLADVIVSTKPACLFFPSPVEPHPDHRASSVIAWEALRKTGFTAEPWSYEISVQGPLNVLLDISPVVAQKRETMAMYASQMTQNHYIERILGLNQARAWSLPLEVSHAEAFHFWPKEDRPLNAMLLDFQTYKLGMDAVPQIATTVSVIIRTKNRPDSLREAIVSVAAQTQRDIELVVVNDGGLDIENLVRQYAVGSICKIVYQSLQPGRGRVGAANTGLEQATGDYLLFLDDDDSISPGHLAKLSRLLESNPAVVLAYTDSKMVDMGGNDLGGFVGEFKPYQIMFGNRFPINAALFRRTAVEAGSCRFDQQFDLFEDWDFWLQLQAQGSFLHVPGMSATYKINPCGSGVQDVSGPRSIEYINIRSKWRGQWPDNWLVDALEAAEKSSVLEKELLRLEIEWNIARYKFIRLDRKVTELATAKDDLVAAKRELLSYKNDYEAVLKSSAWRLTEGPRALLGMLRHTINRLTGKAVAVQSSQAIPHDDYKAWVAAHDLLSAAQRQSMIANVHAMQQPPLISVLFPVYNAPIQFLKEAIESVRTQLYTHWELCIADDASTDGDVKTWLEHYAALDQRIRVVFRTENGQISKSSNTALGMAKGEFMALLNQNDILPEYALYYVAKAIQEHPDAGIIYSDEDKIDDQQNRSNPYFKPDWNYELFLGQNLISHLGVYRRCLLNDIGGFRVGFEGSQDHDLALRCVERLQPRQIIHIPRILYHWRIYPDSAACGIDAKPYALTAGVRAVNEHLRRSCPGATAELIPQFNNYRVRFPIPDPAPRVCIVIPTHNQLCLIRPCIESILARTQYSNYEILVVDNNSDKADVLEYLKGLKQRNNIRVLRDGRPFNFSALNNAAVAQTEAEFVLLLNNDVAVISPDWLGEMVAVASRPGIGAVGARLWYPDDTLQHAGVLLGLNGVAGHAHLGLRRDKTGYCGRACLMQSMSAVTAACLLVRRSLYLEVGGLDEHNLSVVFNDIDFCLKVREAGYRNVWTPFAELYHYESASRGVDFTPERVEHFQKEVTFMRKKWGQQLQTDPAYNPNLTLKDTDFSPAETPRLPPHG